MAKVKTLVESLGDGYEAAFSNLDQKVESLGDIKITKVRDSVMPAELNLNQDGFSYLERVVIYKTKESDGRVEGEQGKPSLDMDLMEFAEVACVSRPVKMIITEAYYDDDGNKNKKTIREFIAMPSGWIDNLYGGPSAHKKLRKTLGKYGFKLYKKGNLIKD